MRRYGNRSFDASPPSGWPWGCKLAPLSAQETNKGSGDTTKRSKDSTASKVEKVLTDQRPGEERLWRWGAFVRRAGHQGARSAVLRAAAAGACNKIDGGKPEVVLIGARRGDPTIVRKRPDPRPRGAACVCAPSRSDRNAAAGRGFEVHSENYWAVVRRPPFSSRCATTIRCRCTGWGSRSDSRRPAVRAHLARIRALIERFERGSCPSTCRGAYRRVYLADLLPLADDRGGPGCVCRNVDHASRY